MATVLRDPEIASAYDDTSVRMLSPGGLQPAVDVLASIADDGVPAIATLRVWQTLEYPSVMAEFVRGFPASAHRT